MAKQPLTLASQPGDVHAELLGALGGEGGREVAGGDDVLDLGLALGKVGDEVHLLPAVLLLAVDPGEAEALEGAPLHEVEHSV